MGFAESGIIALAAVMAGMINAVVGSGTLITFPTLIFLGFPAVSANISNSLGLVAGGASGTFGYRHELASVIPYIKRFIGGTVSGSFAGAILLLVLPQSAFETIVPLLIALSLVLVLVGPRLNSALRRSRDAPSGKGDMSRSMWVGAVAGIFLAGVYGGYFGAAQGVLVVGLLGVLTPLDIQAANGLKNLLVTAANFVAATVFMIAAWEEVRWGVVALISFGSLIGGYLGARVGRRMSPSVLRGVIVLVGIAAIWYMF